jgi:S-adenosylmethionine hydrolase
MNPGVVFLATDYGLDDEFVGVLHAVIVRLAPSVRIVDLSHGISPFDVPGGASLLSRAAPHLGEGVICAVVDPGVGGTRRGVAIEVAGGGPKFLVGPDNGLLAQAAGVLGGPVRAVSLDPALVSMPVAAVTFDGRDLFAPAAARLAAGGTLAELGGEFDPSTLVQLPSGEFDARVLPDGRTAVSAVVTWVDRFGNVQLSLRGSVLEGLSTVGVAVNGDDALVQVVTTFSDLAVGNAGLLRDANGAAALVVSQGSAADRFSLAAGDRVDLVGSFGPLA